MSNFIKIAIFLLAVFGILQLVNSPKNASSEVPGISFEKKYAVPQKISAVLKNSCYDCHSNSTNYPWYGNIQPMEWYLSNHITEGKEKLNFDELSDYGKRKMNSKLFEIINQIEDGEMPLPAYVTMHSKAKLSEQDRKILIQFFQDTQNELKR